MKNAPPFQMKSKLLFGISLVLLIAGIYFGGNPILTEKQEGNETKPTKVALAEVTPVGFVSQGNEPATNTSDLVKTYSQLFGKFQLKVNANWQFSMPTDQEIEALRLDFGALDELYYKIPLAERTKIKRASFPYAQLEVDGKISYKKFEDLTPAERESLKC
jgi:hypothetical protein